MYTYTYKSFFSHRIFSITIFFIFISYSRLAGSDGKIGLFETLARMLVLDRKISLGIT